MTKVTVEIITGSKYVFEYEDPLQVVREKVKTAMVEATHYVRFKNTFFIQENVVSIVLEESE